MLFLIVLVLLSLKVLLKEQKVIKLIFFCRTCLKLLILDRLIKIYAEKIYKNLNLQKKNKKLIAKKIQKLVKEKVRLRDKLLKNNLVKIIVELLKKFKKKLKKKKIY